jgi:hypothetical protein
MIRSPFSARRSPKSWIYRIRPSPPRWGGPYATLVMVHLRQPFFLAGRPALTGLPELPESCQRCRV